MEKTKEIYKCVYTTEHIKIDGLLDEAAWEKAASLSFYIPVTNAKPISKTDAWILWDNCNLYVGFRAYDKDIWGYLKKRDDPTCTEDVLEVFLKTDPQKEPYYNFEVNALGTVLDGFNIKRGAGSKRWHMWNCKGLKIGVKIKGTLNKWEDKDEYWQLEIAIPFKSLSTLKGRSPVSGDRWLFHLSRYDYSVYLPEGVELSSTAHLTEVNFHRYEDWSVLEFIK